MQRREKYAMNNQYISAIHAVAWALLLEQTAARNRKLSDITTKPISEAHKPISEASVIWRESGL